MVTDSDLNRMIKYQCNVSTNGHQGNMYEVYF